MSESITPPVRVLAIGAHPDDLEFMAAGTLARLHAAGCEITLVTMTPGDCGSAVLPPDEIMAIRRVEAQRSADVLNAAYFCLEERDLAIDYDTATRRKVTALLRRVRPHLVLTHPLEDYITDHEITSRLTRDACFTASMTNYHAPWDAPPTDRIPYLYYWDPIEGTNYRGERVSAEFAVDVTEAMDTKREMLAYHASQRDWLRKQHGIDQYLIAMETWTARRGEDFGFRYAEGFVQHRGHPYPQDNLLLQLLK